MLRRLAVLATLLCLAPRVSSAAYALVASGSANGGGSSSTVTTPGVNTTGATLIVVVIGWYGPGATPVLSDSNSNTGWTALTAQLSGGIGEQIYWKAAPTVGSGHTFTAAASTIYASICVAAFTGNAVSPFDQQAGAATGFSTVTSFQPGTLTPSEDNCLVVTGLSRHNTTTTSGASINSGFTMQENQESSASPAWIGASLGYKIQTTAAAVNPTWSWTGAVDADATIASFKAAAGASGSLLVNNMRGGMKDLTGGMR